MNTNSLTADEQRFLAQAIADYMEGIEASDYDTEDKEWCESQASSLEAKLLTN